MVIMVDRKEISCIRAEKGGDFVRAYDASGLIFEATKVTDFTRYALQGGTWETAEPDDMTQTQLALAELAETESAHDLENKLAIAELAETMLGGATNG